MPKFCPNCGAGLVDDQKYCRKCGSSLMTAELVARRETGAVPAGSAESILRADTVRNLGTPSTSEVARPEDGGTRVMGSSAQPGSAQFASSPLSGTQRIEESESSRPTGPAVQPAATLQPTAFPQAKKGFPIAAVLSLIVIVLVAVLGAGYWWYSHLRNKASLNPAAQDAGMPPSTSDSGSATPTATPSDGSAGPMAAGGSIPGAAPTPAGNTNQRYQKDKGSTQAQQPDSGSENAKKGEGDSGTASKNPETNKNQSSTTATQSKATTADDHIKAGLKAYDSGNYSQAAAEYLSAARLQPANADVHYLLGLTYEKLKRPADALAEYQKCTSGPYAGVSKQHVKTLSKSVKN